MNIKSIYSIEFVNINVIFLPPLGYIKISKIFNKEGLKTPRGKIFKNTHVHSIFKKGKKMNDQTNTRPPTTLHSKDTHDLQKLMSVLMW